MHRALFIENPCSAQRFSKFRISTKVSKTASSTQITVRACGLCFRFVWCSHPLELLQEQYVGHVTENCCPLARRTNQISRQDTCELQTA